MEEWQRRVVTEQSELSIKINNLTSFFNSKAFFYLPDEDQYLLEKQLIIMQQYNEVLLLRIQRINRPLV
jgi:hypothetical protein